jgi:hypothetical protein
LELPQRLDGPRNSKPADHDSRACAIPLRKGLKMKCRKAATIVAGLLIAVGAAAPAVADSGSNGAAIGSPGVLSGNVVQVPVDIPVNLCGNSIDIIALLNHTSGNTCANV